MSLSDALVMTEHRFGAMRRWPMPDHLLVPCPVRCHSSGELRLRRSIPSGGCQVTTYFCRQSISGVFDPQKAKPEGHIQSSVLLVPAAKHARLEDMSFLEPSVWLRDHSFELDGTTIERNKGERVGQLGFLSGGKHV